MNSLVFGIALSALFSTVSLCIVLLRVSPITAPIQALSAFFASVFLSVTSISMLIFLAVWRRVPHHTWDTATVVSVSLRQALFMGLGVLIVLLFHLLGLLTWWIALMIFGALLLFELAILQ